MEDMNCIRYCLLIILHIKFEYMYYLLQPSVEALVIILLVELSAL